ncbi:MAG: hypothetical protein ACI8TF_002389 [Paracoccaceae bacterium]|jgi:hypothetical protein
MIPARFAPLLFGLILSGLMSFLVSGITTYRFLGMIDGFMGNWILAWFNSWTIAFPTVLIVAPISRGLVAKLLRPE